jgi:hypothetical protein
MVDILGGLGVDGLSSRTIAGLGIELIDPDVLRLGARRTIGQVTSDKRKSSTEGRFFDDRWTVC